jgi:hypothetical protein
MRVGVMDEELRDEQWELVAPLSQKHNRRGRLGLRINVL